ncbi:ATP-dependent zinc protease family protein [Shewanella psychrotolerans]|uniref:ATP-dependent zinc protease family protein n=1 Tax=Shewanella psychrotolerans TaxID=2864206 RepID=UPI001C65E4C6|nr:ATP-dependent zinc protease [Shewanella psychrotolerans]QYJ99936.1 ATP-dependent zinc protease [Shewanella psychrotolerans]
MLKQMIAIAIASALVGCAAKDNVNSPVPLDAPTLNSSLNQQQKELVQLINTNQETQSQAISALARQVNDLAATVESNQQQEKRVIEVPIECEPSPIGDKFVLGGVENVYIDEIKSGFHSRIDTGAESSSLDAHNIILFERDGKQWVRFDVFTQGSDKPAQTFESKVERFVRIKQDSDENSDRRPVIHAHLQIGKYKAETDLNLVDRSHLEYQLLLGRKFMQDIAVVDVAQSFIHGKTTPISAVK